MQYVEEAPETWTETFWHDLAAQTLPTPASSRSRLGRFVDSLAASMRLQGRKGRVVYGHQPSLTPADIVAQNYPHLYLHVMCG
jgi:hypothetical protein